MEFLESFLGRNGFLPHGVCFTWAPGVLWSMVLADLVIAAAYFSIPLTLLQYFRQRPSSSLRGIGFLASAFIFGCGLTHVMDVWTVWTPDYGLQALTKIATGAVSIVTAIALWHLMPRIMLIPSVNELQSAVARLEAEVARRIATEADLLAVEQNLLFAFSIIDAGFIATDRAGCVTRLNPLAEKITGWSAADAHGQDVWQVFDREDRPLPSAEGNPVDAIIAQQWVPDQVRQIVGISRDGVHTPLDVQGVLTRDGHGSVIGMMFVFRDASAMRRAEEESNRLAAIVASSHDAIIGETLDGQIMAWNRSAERLFGYTADEAIGQSTRILQLPEQGAEEVRILSGITAGNSIPYFRTVRRAKDGMVIEVSVTGSPIRNSSGAIIGGSKIIHDVSHLLAAERAVIASRAEVEAERDKQQAFLERSLAEKEVMLKEIHHRVKNNLQVVSSLLELQAGYLGDANTRRVFDESQYRIRAMALVHEKLYRSRDLAHIDFGDYVNELVTGLVRSHTRGAGRVETRVRAASLPLDIDRAVPCGLVINELVSNSFKHGFPEGRSGTLTVTLSGGDDGAITVVVEDDGEGWAETFDPAETSTLGLQLVHILARQLRAGLQLCCDHGIRATLILPVIEPAKAAASA